MTATPNLVTLNSELVEFSDHLDSTASAVDDVREIIKDVRDILEIPKDIRKASKQLKKTADSGGAMAKVLAKVGVLKPIARPFQKTMYEVSDTFKAIDKKAAELEVKFKPYIAKMKTAEKKLKTVKKSLEKRADETDKLAEHVDEVNTRLAIAKAVVDDTSIPLSTDVRTKLNSVFEKVNNTAGYANSALIPINNTMESIEDKVEDLRAVLSIPEFQGLLDFVNLLKSIQNSLSSLSGPLEAVYDAAGPVIDALGSIFGFVLAPLEAILDAVLEATGFEDLIKEASDFILSLLPDIGVLQAIADALEGALDVQFDNIFTFGIDNPLDGLLAQLDPSQFLTGPDLGLGDPTNGDDVVLGQFGSTVGDTIDAMAGDDVIIGSEYADLLIGGTGADVFIATQGDDTIYGGTDDARDVVIFSGHSDDYAIRAEIGDDGLGTGKWTVSDYTFGAAAPDGDNILYDVEEIVFSDRTFAIGDIDNLVRTRSLDGSYGDVPDWDGEGIPDGTYYDPLSGYTAPHDGLYGYFISTVISDVREIGGVGETITNPDDKDDPTVFPDNPKSGPLQYTTDGVDLVLTGFGYEIIFAGGGNDQIVMTANGPVSSATGYMGDQVHGQYGNDLFLIGAGEGIYDLVYGGDGTDSAVYQAVDTPSPTGSTGIAIFMASDSEAFDRYRPTDFDIDIDFIGRDPLRSGAPRLGIIDGVENLNMTQFDDHVWGTVESNILLGGGGRDQIRGLDGDDILRGGTGDDTLIGDRGNDLLDGGTGSTMFVGGHGNDTLKGDSAPTAVNTAIYGISENETGLLYRTGFVEFTSTGYDDLDMPAYIYVYDSATRGRNWISKFDAEGNSLGQDEAYEIDRLVGSTGDDNITGAQGLYQRIHGLDGNDWIQIGGGAPIDDENSEAVSTGGRVKGGFGDDTIRPSVGIDYIDGDEGSDLVIVGKGQGVDDDNYDGDNSLQARTEGIDTLDLSETDYSWRLYLNDGTGSGNLYGKFPLTIADAEDHKFIQPILGVNGVVERRAHSSIEGVREGVNNDLRFPDANTVTPAGRASVTSFEVYKMSAQRDIVAVGSHENAITVYGYGGDDVLYSAQTFADSLFGGLGDDVLGSFNQSQGSDDYASNFDLGIRILMDGGQGNDTFAGGDAQEVFVGGLGIDELTYEAGPEGVTVNLETGRASGGYAEGDQFTSIENLIGSIGDDILSGDSGINVILGWDGGDTISGNGGQDILYGNDGDDVLSGGAGNDQLHGGLGADTLDGGAGIDTAIFTEAQNHPKGGVNRLVGPPAGVSVDLHARQGGGDALWNIENVTGSLGHDTISGDVGDNLLAGEAGDDLIDGRAGDDILEGGDGDDTLLGGDGDDWLNGGAGANTLSGGAGFDVLDYGSAVFGVTIEMAGVGSRLAVDTGLVTKLVGQPYAVWADSLPEDFDIQAAEAELTTYGTTEVRYFSDYLPDTSIVDEEGITPDRIFRLDPIFARHPDDLNEITLYDPTDIADHQQISILTGYLSATDVFDGFEKISGGAGDDSILGNDEDTEFHGGAGADTIDGGGGDDTLSFAGSEAGVTVSLGDGTALGGDAEGDVFTGVENLTGSAYGDDLSGDAGDNELRGGAGSDTLTGGAGADIAIIDYSLSQLVVTQATGGLILSQIVDGAVVQQDFVADDIEAFRFTDGSLTYAMMAARVVQGSPGDDVLVGSPVAEWISGDKGNDSIDGGAGDDTLEGGQDNDTLIGGTGDDSLLGGTGDNVMIGGPGDDIYYVSSQGDVLVEDPDGGIDEIRAYTSVTMPDHVENLNMAGVEDLAAIGNDLDNHFLPNAGDNTIDGGKGTDTVALLGTVSDAVFDFSRTDYFTVKSYGGTDQLSNIEVLTFGSISYQVEELRSGTEPLTGVSLTAASYFDNGYALDNSRASDGAQFLFIGPDSVGSDYRNKLHFETAFRNDNGRAFYQGGRFERPDDPQPDDAVVNKLNVDFDGANTPDMYLSGLDHAVNDMIQADWAYFETDVFQNSDYMRGSYYADHLVGYAGDDTILGGFGDKELFHVPTEFPSPEPDPLNTPGAATDNPAYWVDDGDDTLDGDLGDDLIDGGTGNDLILGGLGNDQLWGGGDAGDDTLDGGTGNDTLRGGAGTDLARYTTIASTEISVAHGADGALILSTAEGVDWIAADVENFQFSDVTLTRAQLALKVIIGTAGSDILSGTDLADTLEGLGGVDTIYGLGGDDSLLGGADFDVLYGHEGDDTLDGGTDADALLGGPGDDVYFVDHTLEGVIESPDAGRDHIYASVSFTASNEVEDLTLTGDADLNGTGNALDNALTGNSGMNLLIGYGGADTLDGGVGQDTLSGGDGADLLDGGADADILNGGAGDDTYWVDLVSDQVTEYAGAGLDHVMAALSWALADHIEDLTLLDGTEATGNALANRLTGNDLDNLLTGGAGDDTLIGGAGEDTVRIEVRTEATVGVQGLGGVFVGSAMGLDFIADDVEFVQFDNGTFSFEHLVSLFDTLVGSAGADTLVGTPEADQLLGGDSDDRIEGRGGDDLIGGGTGADTLWGEAGADNVTGDAGDDDLSGGDGDDTLSGGEGADLLAGGAGNDRLSGDAGDDTAQGGLGDDLYVVESAGDVVIEAADEGTDAVHASLGYTLGAHVEHLYLNGTQDLDGTGNALDNLLVGNAFDNVLTGGAGDDTAIGGAGHDRYVLGASRFAMQVTDITHDAVTIVTAEGTDVISADIEEIAFTDGVLSYEVLSRPVQRVAFAMVVDGAQVATPTGSAAMGQGAGVYDPIAQTFTYRLRFEGLDWGNRLDGGTPRTPDTALDDVTAAHLHFGDRGIGGGVALDLLGSALQSHILHDDGSREITGTWDSLNAKDILAVQHALGTTLPGEDAPIYVNVHSTGFGGGEIRGQLVGLATDGPDSLTGTAGRDLILGIGGTDLLDAGEGNDTLTGGSDSDTLVGGAGNDTYRFETGFGVDQIQDLSGYDIIEFGAGITRADVKLWTSHYSGSNLGFLPYLETIWAPLAFLTVGDDEIYVEDQFAFGHGDFQGIEEIHFADGTVLDLSEGQLFEGSPGNDAHVPRNGVNDTIDGGGGSDNIEGGDGDTTFVLNPGIGSLFLFDYGGQDVLDFGPGFDPADLRMTFEYGYSLELRLGDDGVSLFDPIADVNYGVEIARFADGTEINLAGPIEMNGTDGADTFGARTDDTLYGHGGDDQLDGGPGAAHIYGGAGNDTLTPGLGDDRVLGGSGEDVVAFNLGSTEVAMAQVTGGLQLTSAEGVDFIGDDVEILRFVDEDLTFAEAAALAPPLGIQGTEAGETLVGTDLAERIDALGGDDTIVPGHGDTVDGGAGFDVLDLEKIADVAGRPDGSSLLQIDFAAGTVTSHDDSFTVNFTGIEGVLGTDFDDFLVGSDAADSLAGNGGLNTIQGGDGNDTVLGGSEVDSVDGGAGNDSIIGYGGDDELSGGADDDFIDGKNGDDYIYGRTEDDYLVGWGGRDRLRGNAGDDTMIGGNKNDFLQGGTGADVFVFNLDNGAWGKDYIKDMELGVDRVVVEGFSEADVNWKTLKSGLGVMAIIKGGGKIVFNGYEKADLDDFADWDFIA